MERTKSRAGNEASLTEPLDHRHVSSSNGQKPEVRTEVRSAAYRAIGTSTRVPERTCRTNQLTFHVPRRHMTSSTSAMIDTWIWDGSRQLGSRNVAKNPLECHVG